MFHDWKLFLGVFALALVLVGALHAYLIYRIQQGNIFVVDAGVRDESIVQQKKIVGRVNAVFADKKAAYEAFEIDRPAETDPSL